MRIGLDIADLSTGVRPLPLAEAVEDIRAAATEGFTSAWVPLIAGGPDPLVVCTVAGSSVPRIELAAAVMRTWPHHPLELARAAITVATAIGGRFVLGVGVSHRHIVESSYGLSFARPARHLRRYLSVLGPLLRGEPVAYDGPALPATAVLDPPPAPIPLLVAAGGPQTLQLAGELADGVLTTMVGARTLNEYVIPTVTRAAEAAGRPTPRIAAAFSVCITDRPDRARDRIDAVLGDYTKERPEFKAMLERENATRPSEIALVGSEDDVRSRLERLEVDGLTDLIASIKAPDSEEVARTRAVLPTMVTGP
jgi:F420-dependent oxidoreductase-like protein